MSLCRYLSLCQRAGEVVLWREVQAKGGEVIDKLRQVESEAQEKFADEWDDQIRSEFST